MVNGLGFDVLECGVKAAQPVNRMMALSVINHGADFMFYNLLIELVNRAVGGNGFRGAFLGFIADRCNEQFRLRLLPFRVTRSCFDPTGKDRYKDEYRGYQDPRIKEFEHWL